MLLVFAAHLFGIQLSGNPAQAAVGEPSPEETVPLENQNLIDQPDFEPGSPYYLNVRSRWAFGFRTGIHNFPVAGALGSTFQIYGEYMIPTFGFGYLSGGIHLGSFPLYAPDTQIPYPNYGNAIIGAQLRYQLKYAKDAIIVPTAAIEWEFYQIKESEFAARNLSGYDLGLSAGLMINMGWIDRMTERDAHKSIGLTRAYLTAEMRAAKISNDLFDLSGNYYLFGFRVELQ